MSQSILTVAGGGMSCFLGHATKPPPPQDFVCDGHGGMPVAKMSRFDSVWNGVRKVKRKAKARELRDYFQY
jgi:hypothetical protein